jgi:hypothetical protein
MFSIFRNVENACGTRQNPKGWGGNMVEYEFVRVGISLMSGKPKEDDHEIIRNHAREGKPEFHLRPAWRITPHMELIFEKSKEQ